MKPLLAAVLVSLVSVVSLCAVAVAADEPEAVYAKYHRAAASGDLAEMSKYAVAAQRSDMAGMSAAQKDAMVKMLAVTMPRGFVLRSKSVKPDGKNAVLVVSGPGASMGGEKPEMLFGTIKMASEGGEWKVAESSWSNNAPAGLADAPAPRSAPAAGAPQKAAAKASAPAGSSSATIERPLGKAREPCVYKPVMTAEDMALCR